MPCLFCGRSPTNREHILSRKWVDKVMPEEGRYRHRAHSGASGETLREWTTDVADVVVNCACEKCNSGWMNRLDERTEAHRTAMVEGQAVSLDTFTRQHDLANWAAKIALLFDQARGEPVLSQENYKWLYEKRQPPPNAFIWLARCETDRRWAIFQAHTLSYETPLGNNPDGYLITFGIPQLVVQVFIPQFPVLTDRTSGYDRFTLQLWPFTFNQVQWPPPKSLPEFELADFAWSFIEAVAP